MPPKHARQTERLQWISRRSRLDVLPQLILRSDLRQIGRQEVPPQTVGECDVFAEQLGFIDRTAIDHQEDGLRPK